MHESTSEVELIARHRIAERVSPALVRTARPARRRTTVARTLRRVADRLEA